MPPEPGLIVPQISDENEKGTRFGSTNFIKPDSRSLGKAESNPFNEVTHERNRQCVKPEHNEGTAEANGSATIFPESAQFEVRSAQVEVKDG